MHADAPTFEYFPAGQVPLHVEEVKPVEFPNLPAAQAVHEVPLAR
jgi:hypothetical protein